MTERDFCYWLQGYSEICGEVPTSQQWEIIQEHLGLVFNKVTKVGISNQPNPFDKDIFNKTKYC